MTSLIRSSALSGYQQLVEELGGQPESFILQSQLDPKRLGDHDYLIPYHALMQLLETTAATLEQPDFGLLLSRKQNLETLGPIALVARASTTVGEALRNIARFITYHSPAIHLSIDSLSVPQSPRLVIDIKVPGYPFRRQTIELSMGLACNTLRLLTDNRFQPEAILFHHASSLDKSIYMRHFGCPVQFAQNTNALCMTRDILEYPIKTADDFQREMLASYMMAQIGNTTPTTLPEQVRFIIGQLLPIMCCNLNTVARQLYMHERTLQRRLKDEGLVFEDLVDAVRRDEAAAYLAEKHMPMSQIAGLLGYQEQSSLNRSVKRWFGMTPKAFRKRLAEQAGVLVQNPQ